MWLRFRGRGSSPRLNTQGGELMVPKESYQMVNLLTISEKGLGRDLKPLPAESPRGIPNPVGSLRVREKASVGSETVYQQTAKQSIVM